jgi:hypothetical protein
VGVTVGGWGRLYVCPCVPLPPTWQQSTILTIGGGREGLLCVCPYVAASDLVAVRHPPPLVDLRAARGIMGAVAQGVPRRDVMRRDVMRRDVMRRDVMLMRWDVMGRDAM